MRPEGYTRISVLYDHTTTSCSVANTRRHQQALHVVVCRQIDIFRTVRRWADARKIVCHRRVARSITKKDMLYNDATPDIDINPETYQVKVDGLIVSDGSPAQRVSMARLYNLY